MAATSTPAIHISKLLVDPPNIRSAPEVFEPVRRQLGVAHGMLDILVAEIGLQSPRIVALVGQREAAGVTQHVGMGLEAELGGLASTLHKPGKARRGEGRAAL